MRQTERALRGRALLAANVFVAAIGTAWCGAQLNHEPAYGDTAGYWDLARSLDLDGYRSLPYPLLLRTALWLPGDELPRLLVYAVQIAAALGAAWYLIGTLDRALGLPSRRRLLVAWVTFSSPLIAHFSVAILPDSLAASAALIGGAASLRIVALGERGAVCAATAFAGLALGAGLRPERPVFFGALLTGAALTAAATRRWRTAVICLALVGSSLLPVALLNHWTQTADVGRPHPTAAARAFERVLARRFAGMYDGLPASIRQVVSIEEAETADADWNAFAPLARRIEEEAGEEALREGVAVGLRCCWLAVVADACLDAVEYASGPLNWVKETLVTGGGGTTEWTNSRMAGSDDRWTTVFVGTWIVVFFANLAGGMMRLRRFLGEDRLARVLGALALSAGGLSVMYAVSIGLDSHIRYGMPIVVLWHVVTNWTALGAGESAPSVIRLPERRDES